MALRNKDCQPRADLAASGVSHFGKISFLLRVWLERFGVGAEPKSTAHPGYPYLNDIRRHLPPPT